MFLGNTFHYIECPQAGNQVTTRSSLLIQLHSYSFFCVCFLEGVNVFLRKIAVAAASRPSVQIEQQGETLSIQTSTSVRTTHVIFTVGQMFNETTVDGRPCTVNLVNLFIINTHPCLEVKLTGFSSWSACLCPSFNLEFSEMGL